MEKYGFFSSINEDRLYTASDFTSYFNLFLDNGIFDLAYGALKVTANNTLEISVNPGVMWINGHVYELTEPKTLTVEPEANLSRRDRVIVVLDHVNREIRAEIKKGEPSDSPEYPALQRDEDKYEMCIAQYQVNKGVTAIQQADIIDTRKDIELCGEVTSVLDKRSLLDFCQIHGFNMEGTINSKDIMPRGVSNIGAFDNRYNKIFCKDIDILNGIPYLSDKGGNVEGTIEVQDIIPLMNAMFRLGTTDKKFAEANIKHLYVDEYRGEHKFNGDNDFVVNNPVATFNGLKSKQLTVNNHQVFIQSEIPANAKAGDVWLKI